MTVAKTTDGEKPISLDQICFESLSLQTPENDIILQTVDLQVPMDQTIVVQSSNPNHAIYMLKVLAGRQEPHSGKILWNEASLFDEDDRSWNQHQLTGCYFETERPHQDLTMLQIFSERSHSQNSCFELLDYFEIESQINCNFKFLSYEYQKLCLLLAITLKNPQLLIMEDPASGLSEKNFLQFLDWIQLKQRQGYLRHIFLTNHQPGILRNLDYSTMYIEDGLIYFEEQQILKKAVHF